SMDRRAHCRPHPEDAARNLHEQSQSSSSAAKNLHEQSQFAKTQNLHEQTQFPLQRRYPAVSKAIPKETQA
ncbi:MAG: hypothetical protein ACRD7E_12280, partial [Bryobacteraceae bacterium]